MEEQIATREVPFRARSHNDPPPPAWTLTDEQKITRGQARLDILAQLDSHRLHATREYMFAAQALYSAFLSMAGADHLRQRMGITTPTPPDLLLPFPPLARDAGFIPACDLQGKEYTAHPTASRRDLERAATELESRLRSTFKEWPF